MYAGRLDRRITIERATTTADAFNEGVETWETLVTVWARAEPISDGEKLRAGETLAHKSYRFQIRYSSLVADVDPRDRLTFDGRTFDIAGVKEIGRREGLEITATARAETP
jgi:SPP1 family predicted phage head-tail adaptor